jgi:hypothetical protein
MYRRDLNHLLHSSQTQSQRLLSVVCAYLTLSLMMLRRVFAQQSLRKRGKDGHGRVGVGFAWNGKLKK